MRLPNKIICSLFLLLLLAGGCNKTTPVPSGSVVDSTPEPAPKPSPPPSGKPPQFVILAFDGSRSLKMWQNTLDFSAELKSQGKPVQFTYFLSGVYFLNYRKANKYLPPQKPAGTSLIGFADSNTDIELRVAMVNRAIAEGHEIGSHANGHFSGANWGKKDWQQEFSQFNNLVFNIPTNNDVDAKDARRYTLNLDQSDVIGFRAPELARNTALYDTLKEENFLYDTSGVGKFSEWPKKLPNGIWEFPLSQIKYANSTSKLLSMDYNFYFKQSKAKDVAKKGDANWQDFYDKTYTSYLNYFNENYETTRAPVFIGSHFSEWNDGVYWEAMKTFAREVCGKPEVRCTTYKELMNYINTTQNP